MIGINLLSKLAKLFFPIIYALFFLKLVPIRIGNSLVLAQNSSGKKLGNYLVSKKKQTPPPNPPDTGSQGIPPTDKNQPPRGPCENMNESLTALLPSTVNRNKVLISQEKPKFWFYVPYEPKSIKKVELKWEELNTEESIREKIQLPRPKTSGIISISVPPKVPPLKDGKQYVLTLTLKIACSSGIGQSETYRNSFTVQMHNLTPFQKNQLNKATTAVQRVNFYSQNELWLDALTETAEFKKNNPQDQNWTTILRDKFQLDESITSQPIVDCCISSNL